MSLWGSISSKEKKSGSSWIKKFILGIEAKSKGIESGTFFMKENANNEHDLFDFT